MKDATVQKLKSFTAFAGVIISESYLANAQIIYTDVIPDDTFWRDSGPHYLDLNNDGFTEIEVLGKYNSIDAQTYWVFNSPGPSGGGYFYSDGGLILPMEQGHQICPTPLSYNWRDLYLGALLNISSQDTFIGLWQLGMIDKYAAFKIYQNAAWARFDVAEDDSYIILKDYAFDSVPYECIVAGQGIPLGVVAEQEQPNFEIFPNPTSSKFFLSGLNENFNDADVSVLDLSGRKIFSQKISSFRNEIDVSSLPNGIYLLELKNNEETLTKKFEVSR